MFRIPVALLVLLVSFGPVAAVADAREDIAEVLDRFHAAAAAADGDTYFSLFAPGGIFLGTDASERWDVAAFRAYAQPHFARGKGWTYVVKERFVHVAADADSAWFHERLDNAKLGACRGTGTLVRLAQGWRIAQYNLSVPIPNALVEGVALQIRQQAGEGN
ncbi:MAG: nuclear transport factor 2 family protein [Gammaproteobacteria bacterium]|nr:nuclear transport factor 2 family protein [Gammaproteobacteria bacterium]